MIYGPEDLTQVLGLGSYVGELRQGPDGNLYEWVAGVDGLGNPIGFWKKAFKAVTGVARKFAARLIPAPLKRLARGVCSNVDQLGPVTTAVPMMVPYYTGAKGLCRVLRRTGIAGGGLMEAPVAAAIPPGARQAARSMCGVINRLGPVMKFIPVAGGYFKRAQGLCTVLRNKGIAGLSGPIMESPEGQLYEVVDTVGESGQPRRRLRPIRLVIPAYVGPRGRSAAAGYRRGRGVQPAKPLTVTPAQPVPGAPATIHGYGGFY